MSPGSPAPAIVVVNFGSHELIAHNLDVATVTETGALVVVVDNFHSDAERTAIATLCSERGWRLVPLPDNGGFGKAVNAGVRAALAAGCRTILLLNPDAVAAASVVSELVAEALRHPMALVAPRIVDSAGDKYFSGSTVNLETGEIRGGWIAAGASGAWQNWLTAACLAFHADAFEAIGGMAEDYFLYWEDVDFSIRAAKAGVGLVLRDDLCVVHDEGGTQRRRGSRAKSALYYYYNTRNRLVFGGAHAAAGSRRTWLLQTPRQSYRIWLRGGRRQLVESPGGLVAAVRGTVAGLRRFLGTRPATRQARHASAG